MDRDRIEGGAKQVKGSIKKALGKVTGNEQAEAKGAAEKAEGNVQSGVGKAKGSVRNAFKK
jgi:uncharacterized protein YjbJ (UPF0337 family)